MRIILLLTLILFIEALHSQNLVKNSSFEEGMCPTNYSQISKSKYWKGFSSDYYKSCPKEKYITKKMSTPYNISGYQEARTGIAYAGLVSPVELLQTKLIEPLKRDSVYYIEFFVNLSDSSSYAIWDIGLYFSNKTFNYSWGSEILDTIIPQIRNEKHSYLTDTVNWDKVSGFYIANGNENILTISSFNKNYENELSSALIINKNAKRKRYYFVDDVYVGRVPKNLLYKIPDVEYETDEYVIQKNISNQLDIIANYLTQNNNININIVGYTDNKGAKNYNVELSKKRADAVKQYLIEQGVNNNRVHSRGEGSSKPISTNTTSEGRKKNRRIEIYFFN